MNGLAAMIVALVAGAGLGTVFFGGLWWTVLRLARAPRPGALLGVSFLIRMAFALAGLYLAARAGWKPLLACLAGFVLARAAVSRLSRPRETGAPPATLVP